MRKRIYQIFCIVLLLTANIIFGQVYVDYDKINQNDIIDTLSFAGKDNLISTDTLIGQSPFELRGNDTKSIRLLTKVENNSFEKV